MLFRSAIEATLVLAGLLLIGNGIAAFQTVVDRQADRVRITVLALAANAVLGLLLIPPLGLTGAVLTYAGTRVTELALAVYYLRRATRGGMPLTAMSRLLAVALLATGVAWLAGEAIPGRFGFVVGGAVFTLVYVPASVLVRYWNNDDMLMIGAITRRLGPPGRWLMAVLKMLQGPARVLP